MITSIFGILLVALGLLAMACQRFYSSVPAHELKRLAARRDHLARALYRPVAYGASLRLFLWIVLGVSLPVGFLLLASSLPAGVAFGLIAASLVVGLVWLPSLQLTVRSARFAVLAAPVLERALHYTHPLLDVLVSAINRYRSVGSHSGLYEKEDLAGLLARQKDQTGNRIAPEELELIQRTLHFGDKTASDVLTPRKEVRLVDAKEALGPVLMDELHASGSPSFPVYDGKKDHIVGTLFRRDALKAKQGGSVASVMRHDVCFVNEDFNLAQVLEAFVATKQYLAVVVNNFDEFLGIITLENLLQQLVGEFNPDDALNYEDRKAVAAYQPKAPEPDPEPQPEQPEPEVTEPSAATDEPAPRTKQFL